MSYPRVRKWWNSNVEDPNPKFWLLWILKPGAKSYSKMIFRIWGHFWSLSHALCPCGSPYHNTHLNLHCLSLFFTITNFLFTCAFVRVWKTSSTNHITVAFMWIPFKEYLYGLQFTLIPSRFQDKSNSDDVWLQAWNVELRTGHSIKRGINSLIKTSTEFSP